MRFYGISTNDRGAVDRLRGFGPLDVLQIGYNLLERSADELLRWAHRERIGTLIRVPLAKGMLTGKYAGPRRRPTRCRRRTCGSERFRRPEAPGRLREAPGWRFWGSGPGGRCPGGAALRAASTPGVSSVIAGAKTRQQIEENTTACAVPPIEGDELALALEIADTIRTPGWIG